ncbi:2-polyprenyl-6-methoxyphenol hydroxylase-like FAD-dependent oxidoreductase [Actinomycetospora succinea]|uniref:2-polyprenyl-6-methoxyphenol hydroxylase-like FAD-dependent oxidoreductase n=1 Tax=Actinomycetospora succinea TaxID=663603 RepID=A0A4V3D9Y6_9PSEU|nr:FAD-dependent oxidoreductase [Actinomycetospora succinea]TDQ58892.1 2-polyprenyl-6-methoxyphenol hydroxylase-like FAD-dependent oxidoreductase [Actinomycetospora succinea]
MTRALIVGGGISGLATAIALAGRGVEVELVDRDSRIHALGSGIGLISPALRALDRLGLYELCAGSGYVMDDFELYDPEGRQLTRFPLPRAVGADLPGMMGMMRPELHRILLDRATALGVDVRTGTSIASIEHATSSATVTFDGAREPATFDLVVGADGLRSTVRGLVVGDVEMRFLGQGIFRVVLPRPAELTTKCQIVGGEEITIGFTPTGADSMYMYVLFPIEASFRPAAADMPELVRKRIEPFGGFAAQVRDRIGDTTPINYTRFENLVVPRPWYRGRVVVLGDAAHATTPHLAAGAAMCLEDVVALGEELDAAGDLDAGLDQFTERRFDRARYVVETSAQISHWETHPDTPGADHAGLMSEAFARLAQPF